MGVDEYDDTEEHCTECGDLLEEDDQQCTSCGTPRGGEPDGIED